jgi:hypothetical protein
MRRFNDSRNKSYRLTIREKDHAELAFAGISTALNDMMEGHDLSGVNQVLQLAVGYESHGRLKENSSKDKPEVNFMEGDSASEDDTEVCIAKWIDTPKDKPLACSFLKLCPRKKDKVKFMPDVSKCDKLFDVLLQNKVIYLSEYHVMLTPGQLAKETYFKWHGTFSHTINECNYFCQQIQSAHNDG